MTKPSILLGPIVGGLSYNSANIWARADSPSTLRVWLAKDPKLKDIELAGEVELPEQDGFAGVLSLSGLQPETQYFYAVNLQEGHPALGDFHSFTTFPENLASRSFSFMFGSCYLPKGQDGSQTFEELHNQISSDELCFGLFLGDQIYADDADHNGIHKIATTLDDYRSAYQYAWSRSPMQKLLPDLPLYMILDDHEVDDDWRFNDPDRTSSSIPPHNQFLRQLGRIPIEQRELSTERIRAALKAYYEHQAMHAPKMLLPLQIDSHGEFTLKSNDEGTFAYTFTFGSAAFFVMDTRTMRVKKGKNKLLGETQWGQLESWLLDVKDKYPVKFLVTSGTILYPFWLDITGDRWAGFRSERERLFELIAKNEVEGIHILTGDLHSAHCISAEIKCPSGNRIPIWEFCASPFEQKKMWSSITYHPIFFSKWIRKQKKHFRQTGNNFGIVHVDFENTNPKVTFTLHYNEDGWKNVPPIST